MAGINGKKVVIAGLAAGLFMNIVDIVSNGFLMQSQWTAAMERLGLGTDMTTVGLVTLIAVDFLLGIVVAFLYAAIRSRFGAGPRTGAIAGMIVWVEALLIYVTLSGTGVYPWSLVAISMALSLIGVLGGGYVAARLYSE